MKQFVFFEGRIDPAMRLGYLTNFLEIYAPGKRLGSGSNGSVFTCIRRSDSVRFAVKVIPKVVTDPGVPESLRGQQFTFIRREVEVLLTLRGNLNVATLEQVFEDPNNVFLVMELCRGGEILGRHSHYTELETANIIRMVLRTIAQMNAHGILHRDIKPENFLLLNKTKDAPVKAIDFGLAVFYTPESLPITAPQPSGSLWYMSPEATLAKWYPNSDVWSCGIMVAFMLVGMCPFVDNVTPEDPSPARVFKAIRTEEFDSTGPKWSKLSPVTVDFVKYLLEKDPLKRPSATEALMHPFLSTGVPARTTGVEPPVQQTLVQRLQRFAQNGVFKRCLLEHIAADFMNQRIAKGEATLSAAQRLTFLLDSLDVDSDGKVERGDLQAALLHMGFRLDDHEAAELFDAVDVERRGAVEKAELSASLLDWGEELDRNGDGELDAGEIAALFKGHLEPYEVDAVVHEALLEALGDDSDVIKNKIGMKKSPSIDFDQMLGFLESGSVLDDLRLFDDRLGSSPDSHNFSLGKLDEAILANRRATSGSNGGSSAKRAQKGMRRVLSLKCLG